MYKEYVEKKTTKRSIDVEPFFNEIVKVTDTFVITTNGVTKTVTNVIFTTMDNVEKVQGLERISTDIYVEGIYQNKATLCMISKSDWNLLFQAKVHISDIVKDMNVDVFNEDDYMMVLFDYGSYELLDLNKEYIPIPIHINYEIGNGRMTNGIYDLKKVMKLLEDKDIILGINRFKKDIETLEIQSIPYYNVDGNHTHELSFWFVPSKEVFTEGQKIGTYERSMYMFLKTFNIKQEDILCETKEMEEY